MTRRIPYVPSPLSACILFVLAAVLSADVVRDDFIVQSDTDDDQRRYPHIECTPRGNGILTWLETYLSSTNRINGARFDTAGRYTGSAFTRHIDVDGGFYGFDMADSGHYAVVTATPGSSPLVHYVVLDRYHAEGTPLYPFPDELAVHWTGAVTPDVAVSNQGLVAVVYSGLGDSAGIWVGMVPESNDPDVNWIQVDTAGIEPRVALDDAGYAMVCFRQGFDLVYRMFDVNATPTPLHDTRAIADNILDWRDYECDCSPDGDFIVTWQEATQSCISVHAQRYDRTGTAVGGQIDASGCTNNAADKRPRVSMGINKSFVIAWQNPANDMVYTRIFQPSGGPATPVTAVLPAYSETPRYAAAAIDGDGRALIGWSEAPDDNEDIFMRRYAYDATALGPPVRMHARARRIRCAAAAVDRRTAHMAAAWYDEEQPGIYVRLFDDQGRADTTEIPLEDFHDGAFREMCCAMDGRIFCAYRNNTVGHLHIIEQDGSLVQWRSEQSGDSLYGLSLDAEGDRVVLAWTNPRLHTDSVAQVQAMVCDYDGSRIADSVLVGTGSGAHVAVCPDGGFVVAYHRVSTRYFQGIPISTTSNVYLRRFDNEGTPVSNEIQLNEGGWEGLQPCVGVDGRGRITAAWRREVDMFTYEVYFRRFDSLASPLGVVVRADEGADSKTRLDIAVNDDGALALCWENMASNQIEMRMFSTDNTPHSGVHLPSSRTVTIPAPSPSIDAGGDRLLLSWVDITAQEATERDVWAEVWEIDDQGPTGLYSPAPHAAHGPCHTPLHEKKVTALVAAVFDPAGRRIARLPAPAFSLRALRRAGITPGVYIIRYYSPDAPHTTHRVQRLFLR